MVRKTSSPKAPSIVKPLSPAAQVDTPLQTEPVDDVPAPPPAPHVPQLDIAQPEVDPDESQQNSTTKPKLPAHLRERWIVSSTATTQPPTNPSYDVATMTPVQYGAVRPMVYPWPAPYNPVMTYIVMTNSVMSNPMMYNLGMVTSNPHVMNNSVANIYPNALPYMMPQQHQS